MTDVPVQDIYSYNNNIQNSPKGLYGLSKVNTTDIKDELYGWSTVNTIELNEDLYQLSTDNITELNEGMALTLLCGYPNGAWNHRKSCRLLYLHLQMEKENLEILHWNFGSIRFCHKHSVYADRDSDASESCNPK
jgi:hypothetical protein